MSERVRNPDCICDGRAPWCASCVVAVAFQMRIEHRDTLSPSMLKRRMGRSITGREAALLVEATKGIRLPPNGNGSRYVESRRKD